LLVAERNADSGASQVLWFGRKGQQIGIALNPGIYGNVMLAPNGKVLASDTTDPASQNTNVWTYDLENRTEKRLTSDAAFDALPIWSPDGGHIVFSSNREHKFELYLKDSNGANDKKMIGQGPVDAFPTDWSRDGEYIIYQRGSELWFMTMPELPAVQFLKRNSSLKDGPFSPDGKRLGYSSNESGRWEIYVSSFPEGHLRWQVSNAGGHQARWRGDGKELFYLSGDGNIMAVPVKTGANFDAGSPVILFQANPREMMATSEQFAYGVSNDGQKFLINTQIKTAMTAMSLVLNWGAKLQ
jgi:eukaryotic-like serine/threonine-protein kinase